MITTLGSSSRAALALLGLALVCIVGIIVLTALHDTIPAILEVLATGSLTGGAGIAVPAHTDVTTTAPAPAPVPGQGA